ncbi:hypothetical protein CIB48_g9074 [Xylaria polymorpha]|nr:hypothetical protein CIB48_g9074 [Xylaria polymorpha]
MTKTGLTLQGFRLVVSAIPWPSPDTVLRLSLQHTDETVCLLSPVSCRYEGMQLPIFNFYSIVTSASTLSKLVETRAVHGDPGISGKRLASNRQSYPAETRASSQMTKCTSSRHLRSAQEIHLLNSERICGSMLLQKPMNLTSRVPSVHAEHPNLANYRTSRRPGIPNRRVLEVAHLLSTPFNARSSYPPRGGTSQQKEQPDRIILTEMESLFGQWKLGWR